MECGDSHTDRAEDGGPGGEMVRKARWHQERLVQRKPNKVSKSTGLVSWTREFWAVVGQSQSAADDTGVTGKKGHGDSVCSPLLQEDSQRKEKEDMWVEVWARGRDERFSLMGYVFRMREKTLRYEQKIKSKKKAEERNWKKRWWVDSSIVYSFNKYFLST